MRLLTLLLVSSLAGCSSLQGVTNLFRESDEKLAPQGALFDRFLYEGYRKQGRKEEMEHDYESVEFYVKKSQMAKQGELVLPQEISERNIPQFALEEITEAKKRIDSALASGAPVKMPKEMADAQVSFDCWLEQQEENIQQHDIDECKQKFDALISQIEQQMLLPGSGIDDPCKVCDIIEPVPAMQADVDIQPSAPIAQVSRERFELYFFLDSTELIPGSKVELSRIQRALEGQNYQHLALVGHADRSGSDSHNDNLSSRRVSFIRSELVKAGLDANRSTISYVGEAKPQLPTRDGVREQQNRRVEVIVDWSR